MVSPAIAFNHNFRSEAHLNSAFELQSYNNFSK